MRRRYNDTHAEAVSSGDLHWGKGDFWRMVRARGLRWTSKQS